MKFHNIHGCNVTIDDGGSRASRTSSFCDGITFSHKPIAINSRISLLLGANEDWTGALRLGVTSQDPNVFANKKLPRYACPDLTSNNGYWARPLPEVWAAHGTRLTFYVNSRGHLHLFVNSEHKGAILLGLPVKEQLWVLLDLYGITVSAKFVSNSGTAPSEVIARGPEAVLAYQHALSSGSTPYYHTRIALVGPPDGKKTVLKKLLVKSCDTSESECEGIDTTCLCQTSEISDGEPWTLVKKKICSSLEDANNNQPTENISVCDDEIKQEEEPTQVIVADEEYFKAIAINIVREICLQKKRNKDDRRKTPTTKNTFRLQSSLTKIGASKGQNKQDDSSNSKEFMNTSNNNNDDLPNDLPSRVVELVEAMLKESECKLFLEKKDTEKLITDNVVLVFNIWNYSGHWKNLLLHQLFLSPQTIYLFVFDLAQDLDTPIQNAEDFGLELSPSCSLSYLSLLHKWLEMIYVSIAHTKDEDKNQIQEGTMTDIICTLFPPVLIVGIQEESTTFDTLVEHQFNKIKESIQDKVYCYLVHPTFYFVGNPEDLAVDSMITDLRKKIQELALQLPHVGIEIPLKWMLFDQAIDRLIEREVYFADINKLSEVARLENIDSDEEFYSMIHFFHHQGKIWHLRSEWLQGSDEDGCGIVILKPQWFINYIYQLMNIDTHQLLKESFKENECSETDGTFPAKNFEKVWPNAFHHTSILLDILDSTDVICEVIAEDAEDTGQSQNSHMYIIPWLIESNAPESEKFDFDCLILILDFAGLLPVGFFTKFMVRLLRWSKHHNLKKCLNQTCSPSEVPVDYNHCIKVQKTCGHRIQVIVTQRTFSESEGVLTVSFPSPHACSKVRHLLERETEHLRDVWYKRMSYSLNVPCPCEKPCELHNVSKCSDPECLHLQPLNECLAKKVVECDYRLIKTDFIRKFFFASIEGDIHTDDGNSKSESKIIYSILDSPKCSNSMRLSLDSMSTPFLGNFFWGDHDISQEEPSWLTIVGKKLTSANTGQDWIALAKRLGYSEREIKHFEDENVPSVNLLNNWLDSNGRTRYCIDMLISCLEQMGRRDVADCIFLEMGSDLPSPPVFISYQWDSQESVLHLRRRIELAGYPCWMDVGHIFGGDKLYGKIFEGINKAKVVLCCLTPRYVLSKLCTREMSLADLLRKPIVPIMLEPTPWPPPGPLALILSSLVYINLCGIGGHGGSGRQADWESRFSDIIERLSHFISPSFPSHQLTTISTERFMPPPAVTVIRNTEGYNDAPQHTEERGILDNPSVPLPDDDTISEAASIHGSSTPTVWDPTHRNRVTRCSICVLL